MVESFQGLRVFALRWSSQNCGQDTYLVYHLYRDYSDAEYKYRSIFAPISGSGTEKRSDQYNWFLHFIVPNTSTIYTELPIISRPHYSSRLIEFCDMIKTQVLPVRILYAKATT